MADFELTYFFDPLCGWCYASAPALAGIVAHYGDQLRMMPVGLFFELRPVAAIADYAWRNDQRIAGLTGQRFSEDYRRNVLEAPHGSFTSALLTTALCALGEIAPRLEPRFLHDAQIARYVEGRDTSRVEEVVRVAEAVALQNGVAFDAASFADRLQSDRALGDRVQARMAAARREMQALPATGVPLLLVRLGDRGHLVSGQTLYHGKDAVLSAVQQLALSA